MHGVTISPPATQGASSMLNTPMPSPRPGTQTLPAISALLSPTPEDSLVGAIYHEADKSDDKTDDETDDKTAD